MKIWGRNKYYEKGINIIIYSVLALAVIFGNISIINFIINDKEIMSMAEATKEPVIMPTETPEISYHVLVKELPVFKYNTILENKTKDAIMGKYLYGDKIKVKEEKTDRFIHKLMMAVMYGAVV